MSSIVDKIKKLLAIAHDDAASEGEIQNALGHAQRLMDEHHLSEEDLKNGSSEYEFSDVVSFVGKKFYRWELVLSEVVKRFVGCSCYMEPNLRPIRANGIPLRDNKGGYVYAKSIVWYGVVGDIEIARELYDELRLRISTMAKDKYGSVYKGEGGVYSEGFVYGLHNKITAAKSKTHQTESTGLTVRREELIQKKIDLGKEWLSRERTVELEQHTSTGAGAKGSVQAYLEGYQDGKKTDMNSPLNKKVCS